MPDCHSAVIAGTHSSVGKTTWFLALASFLRRKGYSVQPFKVGPDYIDPGFHHRVCFPRKSRNLDHFFLSEIKLRDSFERHSVGADFALAEGVMGLFDGRLPLSEEGSTAQMAKILGIPVFLVIDAGGMARSAAALAKGYQSFDPKLDLRGILLNRVGSEGHFRWLRESVEKETGIPVLGWLPEEPAVSIPERHLGLATVNEEDSIEKRLNQLAELLENRLDKERFLKLCKTVAQGKTESSPAHSFGKSSRCRIGVAYDKAFSFYYEDNFDLLREEGAELVFFSPLAESELPPDLDALYLGGGFPEIYAASLSDNGTMKDSIRKFHEEKGLIYAECGGLMYLAETLIDTKGKEFSLVGIVPGKIRMAERLQNFGYHEIQSSTSTFLFGKGEELRSHEFHYSVWETIQKSFVEPYRIGEKGEGFYDGHLLATYQHLHFGQRPALARNFVRAAQTLTRKRHVHSG